MVGEQVDPLNHINRFHPEHHCSIASFQEVKIWEIFLIKVSLLNSPKISGFNRWDQLLRQHNIGFPWQLFIMQPVPETLAMQEAPHQHLRLRILVADPAHVVAAGSFAVYVCHRGNVRISKLAN
jgi:hypothetical protein